MQDYENMDTKIEQDGEFSESQKPDDTFFGDGGHEQREEGGELYGAESAGQEETEEKPKRKAKKKKDESDLPDGEQPVGYTENPDGEMGDWPPYGEYQDEGGDEGEASPEPDDPASEDTSQNVTPTRRRRTAQRRPAVLDSSGNVIQERPDMGQHDLSILTAAKNRRKILTATVDGIEADGVTMPRVVFYVGDVKVMIPFSQLGFDLDPETVSQREARLLIDSMLGAVIDYMVVGVDTQARIAGASRRAAMLMRQRTILNARNTNGFRINEGMRVTARILHVSQMVLRVEVFGFETWLRIDSISNLWVNDIREVVQVGQERPVEIVRLVRDENGRVTSLRVSMKAAEDAPQLTLREGNTYTGYISNFSSTAYYVRVAGIPIEIRCPIASNYTIELMEVGDYVKFFVRAVYDEVPTGAILKIIKKKNAGM